MLAILRACSNAYSDGLQRTGVFGRSSPAPSREKCWRMSKRRALVVIPEPSTSDSASSEEWLGFSVSQQMIPSKQSSNPSLLRALAAWILSAFVNIYFAAMEVK